MIPGFKQLTQNILQRILYIHYLKKTLFTFFILVVINPKLLSFISSKRQLWLKNQSIKFNEIQTKNIKIKARFIKLLR